MSLGHIVSDVFETVSKLAVNLISDDQMDKLDWQNEKS